MKKKLSEGEKAKALYRRAQGHAAVKDDKEAIADLEKALKFAPTDSAIQKE